MDDTSGGGSLKGFGRPLRFIAAWAVFVLVAHELIHLFLWDVGPVPGRGLATLALQALLASLGAIVLIVALHPLHIIRLRTVLATVIWVTLIVFGHYLAHLPQLEIRQTLEALREGMGMGALLASAAMLALLLGVPFVPSVEMGLLMMAVFGHMGALAAWLATIAGLSLAYAAGRYMPAGAVSRWLARQGLTTAANGEASPGPALEAMIAGSRLGRAGGRIGAYLLRHRYVLFAVLINLPGNSVLGGGGGIALVSGFARLYRWPWFVLTTALASLPIPLLVFLGLIRVEDWLGALGN